MRSWGRIYTTSTRTILIVKNKNLITYELYLHCLVSNAPKGQIHSHAMVHYWANTRQGALQGQIAFAKYNVRISIWSLAMVHYRGKCLQNIHSVHSRRLQDRINSSLSFKYIFYLLRQLLSFKYKIFIQTKLPSSKYNFSEYILLLKATLFRPNEYFKMSFSYRCNFLGVTQNLNQGQINAWGHW